MYTGKSKQKNPYRKKTGKKITCDSPFNIL
jgi:hypothetical protein